jgi:hypothetical protein
MQTQKITPAPIEENGSGAPRDAELQEQWRCVVGRRSFLKGLGVAGAAAPLGSALLADNAFPPHSDENL